MSAVTKHVSLDGQWYYLKNGDTVPTGWLSLSGEPDRNGVDWLPFAFWDVKKGKDSPASEDEVARYEARNAPLSRPRKVTQSTEEAGIYAKYTIIKNSTGETIQSGAFVLLPEKDVHARIAILNYAKSVEGENSILANQLRDWIWSLPKLEGA